MKIALGTTSIQKIKYLNEVLEEIGVRVEIVGSEVNSGVSEQPIEKGETERGSLNRARSALELNPDCDFGLGIEVGYNINDVGKYEIFCCASAVGKDEYLVNCSSSKILLPSFHQEILKQEKYLGEHVGEYKKDINEPVTNYMRELVRGRKPIIKEAVRNVLLRCLNRDEYK